MSVYEGFRADRLKKAMTENEAAFEDMCEEMRKDLDLFWEESDREYLRRIINGKAIPGLFDIFTICKAVNVSADYLLGLSDEMY